MFDQTNRMTDRVLSFIPSVPLADVPVPAQLLSEQPATERGYDLAFAENGKPRRGRPLFGIDGAMHVDETAAGACQKKAIVPKSTTAAVATYFCGHGWCYGYDDGDKQKLTVSRAGVTFW